LHIACRDGHLPVVEALLAQAPETAHGAADGWLPQHEACANGHSAVVSRLLAAIPASVDALTEDGDSALHIAAGSGQADVIRILLTASPSAALEQDNQGETPLHLAARGAFHQQPPLPAGCTAAVQLLLAAAPESVHMPDHDGILPLHGAASAGHTAAVRLLLEAAPDTAAVKDVDGNIPLVGAMHFGHLDAARLLVAASPASTVLDLLETAPPEYWPESYLTAFVRAHLPLREQQWEQLGRIVRSVHALPNPSLGHALPAALEHSAAQAHQLVRLLTHQQQRRLHMFGLCLARLQRRLGISLPGPLSGKLMALFDT
jgi:ankyrin repeat protein